MINTSYFANYRNFGELKPISISRYSPKWYDGETILNNYNEFKDIVPLPQLLKQYKDGKIDSVGYVHIYIKQLQSMDFEKFLHAMNNTLLLCYEKPNDFCHRKVIKFYAERNFNYKIFELGIDNE